MIKVITTNIFRWVFLIVYFYIFVMSTGLINSKYWQFSENQLDNFKTSFEVDYILYIIFGVSMIILEIMRYFEQFNTEVWNTRILSFCFACLIITFGQQLTKNGFWGVTFWTFFIIRADSILLSIRDKPCDT